MDPGVFVFDSRFGPVARLISALCSRRDGLLHSYLLVCVVSRNHILDGSDPLDDHLIASNVGVTERNIQGLHNVHGSFNAPNTTSTLTSRNSSINSAPFGAVQQPAGNLPSGRFTSTNIPVPLSQISHGNTHAHSGITNRGGMSVVGSPGYGGSTNGVGGSITGILPTSAAIGNRGAVPGLGVSSMLGNAGPRISGSLGSLVGNGNMGRHISSGGGLSMPGLPSRLNLTGSSGPGLQGPNRLLSGMLPQASPQVLSMLSNSYPSAGGPLSQGHGQAVNNLSSLAMLTDVNPNDSSPFDINDFPQLTSRPNSSGGPQGQLGSLRKQGLGVGPIVQQNQEFSIQNEDFPALPGFKGGNSDYGMDIHQKEQHDSSLSMMQSQHFIMGRSAGFNLGGSYSSHRLQPQHTPPSSGPPGIGIRGLNSGNPVGGIGSYDQLMQYQQQQTQPQFRLQQMSAVNQSFRDQGIKPLQAPQSAPDPYGLLGLLSVIRMSDQDLTQLALGMDLTTLGLNLNSSENLHKTFASPWSEEPAKGDPEFTVPPCYYAQPPPPLRPIYFRKFQTDTLFYIFYSMPKDEAQLLAANELYDRHWLFHKEQRFWFKRPQNMELSARGPTYERGSYVCFDPTKWEKTVKDNFIVHYDAIEKRPSDEPQ
ncbi:putative NOT transcription complex subunit VIP2 [Drosera capensis]